MVLTESTLIVGSVPAVFMLLFTIVGLKIKVPDALAGALQHFAAGLLLSAVGSELLPVLLKAEGVQENVYATVGFFLGMGVLIVLGALLPEAHSHGDDDDDDHHDDHGHGHGNNTGFEENIGAQTRRASTASTSLRGMMSMDASQENTKALSLRQAAKAINEKYCTSCERIEEAGACNEGKALLSSARNGANTATPIAEAVAIVDKALPFSFLAAIVVDSFMDGFLIGITGAAGPGATIIMAGSLSVEMSFVGLTLATACHGMPYAKAIPAALAGPITLVIGSILGGLLTTQIAGDPATLAGIMGFGTSALLFMVAEELLLEAHEDGEHVWWVDVQLYTGFYWGFMSTKFLPA